MSLLPIRSGRLEDPAFLQSFREYLTLELLEFVTNPSGGGYCFSDETFNHFQVTGRFPRKDVQIYDFFVRVCQDIRLTPDEIDQLSGSYF